MTSHAFRSAMRRFCHGDTGWPCGVYGVTPVKAFARAKGEPFGATTHRF